MRRPVAQMDRGEVLAAIRRNERDLASLGATLAEGKEDSRTLAAIERRRRMATTLCDRAAVLCARSDDLVKGSDQA